MTISQKLSQMGLSVIADSIPDKSYDKAKILLLDALGCAIAGHNMPGIHALQEQICDWGGKAEASLFISGGKVPLPNAVFLNGAMIHALDFDDVYLPGTLHLTSTIVPVVLGVAEKTAASGMDCLSSLIMGIEIAGQLGIAQHRRNPAMALLPSSMLNGFGAIISAARLFKMTVEATVNAMGINYTQISGNRQALLDMTLAKRIQPSFAGRSAVWAFELAKRGITGPTRTFEGEAGYCRTYLNDDIFRPEEFKLDLYNLQIDKVSMKKYPSCGACHNVQIAAERLMNAEYLHCDEIEKIEIFNCGPGGFVSKPFKPGKNPQVDAQFSVIWAVAHTFVNGPAKLEDYTDEKIGEDQAVLEFSKKISFTKEPDGLPEKIACPADFPGYSSMYQGIIVHTKNGRKLQSAQCPWQTFNPALSTLENAVGKFKECVTFSGLKKHLQAENIIETVLNLNSAPSIKNLMQQLVKVPACR
ncbi:MAG: MmgE/PrpD family protein [Victivallaceae bacterium]|nr:MmgE/PrpD family protein [Victivallaceae bacterium]